MCKLKTPSLKLALDTGRSNSDAITRDGTVLVSNIEKGADWYYKINNGLWVKGNGQTINLSNQKDGHLNISVKQLKSGKESKINSLSMTLDTTAPKNFKALKLSNDTGRPNKAGSFDDFVTKIKTQTVSGVLENKLGKDEVVRISLDNGKTWNIATSKVGSDVFSYKGDLVKGLAKIKVRVEDAAGNYSEKGKGYQLKDKPGKLGVGLKNDTSNGKGIPDDKITKDASLNIANVEARATVQYSTDGGQTWSESFTAKNGRNDILVRQVDVANNESDATGFCFVLKGKPGKLGVDLKNDTSNGKGKPDDKITKDASLNIANVETDATVQYSTDGGLTWSETFTAKNGRNDIFVRQIDIADNESDVTDFSFIYKTSVKGLGLGLARDTGRSNSDKLTKDATLSLSDVEDGAIVEYSVDGGQSWSDSFSAQNGRNDVRVRQIDMAGNVSEETDLSFVYKTSVNGLGLGLARDTGRSNSDKLTNDATLSLSGVEDGASVEYSIDGGQTWSETFSAQNGRNDVRVRQIDAAGNVSEETDLSFVYKT
jgi:hypothetical protein